MDALQNAGIRTERAYPGRRMQVITAPVAAVSLAQADHIAGTAKVCITIMSPARLGGAACEDQAEKAARAVAALGAQCVQEACGFESQADLYCAKVFVSFTGAVTPTFSVLIGGVALPAAVRFEAWKEVDGKTGTTLANATWQIRLEETFLPGRAETVTAEEPFSLTVIRDRSTEVFDGCVWTRAQRTDERGQLLQVRIGTASTRSFTVK
jgi:hypothetical protein